MSAKPRNNYAKLPWEIRKRVLRLLLDGAEYEAIRRDPEVAAACAARGLSLHNTTFAISCSPAVFFSASDAHLNFPVRFSVSISAASYFL